MRGLSSTMNNASLTVMVMKNEPGSFKDKIKRQRSAGGPGWLQADTAQPGASLQLSVIRHERWPLLLLFLWLHVYTPAC